MLPFKFSYSETFKVNLCFIRWSPQQNPFNAKKQLNVNLEHTLWVVLLTYTSKKVLTLWDLGLWIQSKDTLSSLSTDFYKNATILLKTLIKNENPKTRACFNTFFYNTHLDVNERFDQVRWGVEGGGWTTYIYMGRGEWESSTKQEYWACQKQILSLDYFLPAEKA